VTAAVLHWIPEGITKEYRITVQGGISYTLDFFPFKMFQLDIVNEGPDPIQIMLNDQGLPDATTLSPTGPYNQRRYDAKHPAYKTVTLFEPGSQNAVVVVTATR
jgi:hypothetical protein